MSNFTRLDIKTVDMMEPLKREHIGVLLATGDRLANRFGADLRLLDEPVNLDGAVVTGYFIKPDCETVLCEGVVDGSTVYVDLPAACYTQDGRFSFAIKVSSTEVIGTVRVIDGVVRLTQTDTLVDSGEVVPSVDELLAIVADVEAAASPIVTEASGAVATMTDAAARDAQALVTTIRAVQPGEGNPAPDNYRPVSGRDAASLCHGAAYDEAASPALTAALPETVYGGTLDWVTGVLTVTHRMLQLTGASAEGWTSNGSGHYYAKRYLTGIPGATAIDGYCTHYRYANAYAGIAKSMQGRSTHVWLKDTDLTSVDAVEAYLAEQAEAGTPVTLVYPLETPYTVRIDPQQLTLLKGSNALWSDTGDTSVTYTADTKMYIDNKFTALQNAILAQGANI